MKIIPTTIFFALVFSLVGITSVAAQDGEDHSNEKMGETKTEANEVNTKIKIEAQRKNEDARNESGTNEEMNGQREAKVDIRTNTKTEVKLHTDASDERSAEVRENQKERIRIHASWMTRRFEAAIERFEKLADRIDSRIEKMKAESVDTASAESLAVDARVHIGAAATGFADLRAKLETSIDTGKLSREAIAEMRGMIKEIKTELKEAHTSLREAVLSLKANSRVNVEASTNANSAVQ